MKTVLLVDDHRLIFDGLKASLYQRFVFLYAPSLPTAREALSRQAVDLCILDLSLGKEIGFDLLSEIGTSIPTFLLTMHKSVNLLRRGTELGARGYFLKDESLDLLVQAMDAPLARPFWISESLAAELGQSEFNRSSSMAALTEREQQVFVMLAEGLNYKEIAFRLGISPKTVNIHRDNVMKKMGFESPADLVRSAIRMGLIIA